MKKIFKFSLAILLLITCLVTTIFANGISVTLNGVKIDFADQEPTIVEGRTLVPLRAIFEALGASVEWDGATSTVTSQKDSTTISLTIGSNVLYRNGEAKTLDVPAQIMNGRTMVPARAVAEAYGVKVDWDGYTQTVILNQESVTATFDYKTVPAYSGSAYYVVNNNKPFFTAAEMTTASFEKYAALDSLGRCGVAFANVGKDIMPTEERGSIGSIKPSGWQTIRYEFIDGRYLYNRCHLIGYQLSGENANTSNLITGTRYLNVEGMLPFENDVAAYVERTNNHVLYRVTPIFEGNNLLASGVLMEGYSVEDNGGGISFCVFCYNVQPGIVINYANGESYAEDGSAPYGSSEQQPVVKDEKTETEVVPSTSNTDNATYIANKNTKKFHHPTCRSASDMKEKNKLPLYGTRDDAVAMGYSPCGNCKP